MPEQNKNGLMTLLFGSPKKLEQGQAFSSLPSSGTIDLSKNNISSAANSYSVTSSETTITFARVPKGEIAQTEKTVTAFTDAGMESEGPILNAFAYKNYPIYKRSLPGSIRSSRLGPSSEVGFSDKAILLYKKKVRSSAPTQPLQEASDTRTLVSLRSIDLVEKQNELADYEITVVIDEEMGDVETMLESIQGNNLPSIDTNFPQIPTIEGKKVA